MSTIDAKNAKINKIVKILKREYLNSNNLSKFDMNPKHFIDEYQFIKYMTDFLSEYDGHFYDPDIISYKYYIKWIANPHGYVCIDMSKMHDFSVDNLPKKNNKIVLDMRAASPNKAHFNFLISFVFTFSCIRSQFTEPRTIYKYINKENQTDGFLEYRDGYLVYKDMKNKVENTLYLKKLQTYEADEIVCLSINNTINTKLLHALGVPIYVEKDTPIGNMLYERSKLGKYEILIPTCVVECETEYSYTVGIPEKYYPMI